MMKKYFVFLIFLFILILSFLTESLAYASSRHKSLLRESIAINPLEYISAARFVHLTPKGYCSLTGKKLSLLERLSFSALKLRLRHDLKRNPHLKLSDYLDKERSGSFNFRWFLLGLGGVIVGLFAANLAGFILLAATPIVIAYATKQSKDKIRSVWQGFGTGILIVVILALIVASALTVY